MDDSSPGFEAKFIAGTAYTAELITHLSSLFSHFLQMDF
jgi:hypothetical protein